MSEKMDLTATIRRIDGLRTALTTHNAEAAARRTA